MQEKYRVIYTGKLGRKANFEHAVEQVSNSFKISKDQAVSFLSSDRPRVIKRNLSFDQAEKYRSVLTEIGLNVKVMQEEIVNKEKVQRIQKEPQGVKIKGIEAKTQDHLENDDSKSAKDNELLTGRCKKKLKTIPMLIGSILIIIAISSFLLLPDILQNKYTQDETYRKNKVWYQKESNVPLNGILIQKNIKGQLQAKVPFKDGLIDGVYKIYYPDSAVLMSEVEYVKGQKHGKAITMNESGYLVTEAHYVNDKEHGEHRHFRGSSGTLEHRSVYNHGEYVLSESYRTDGEQLAQRIEYKNGKQILNLHYSSNGKINSESISKDGYTLKVTHYYDSGEVNSYTYYEKGKRKLAEYFEKSGQPYLKVKYNNGKKAHIYKFQEGKLVTETIIKNGIEEIIQHKKN